MGKAEGSKETRKDARLQAELERLKTLLHYGADLKVRWVPDQVRQSEVRQLSGEVVGDIILIYDGSEAEALETLRHEFIDYVLTTELIKPLVDLINLLVKERERETYQRKERLVKRLTGIISSSHEL